MLCWIGRCPGNSARSSSSSVGSDFAPLNSNRSPSIRFSTLNSHVRPQSWLGRVPQRGFFNSQNLRHGRSFFKFSIQSRRHNTICSRASSISSIYFFPLRYFQLGVKFCLTATPTSVTASTRAPTEATGAASPCLLDVATAPPSSGVIDPTPPSSTPRSMTPDDFPSSYPITVRLVLTFVGISHLVLSVFYWVSSISHGDVNAAK